MTSEMETDSGLTTMNSSQSRRKAELFRATAHQLRGDQRWSRGHKARGQGQGQGHKKNPRPRPRTAFPRTDTLEAKDRNAEAKAKDQGHKAQVLSQKKKKKVFTKIFQAISKKINKKKSSQKFFRRSPKKKKKKKRSSQKFFKRSPRKNAFQKIFQPLHKILTFQKIVLSSSRGQANFRGLEASRPRPRTSKSVVLEDSSKSVVAKDVLEDSTSGGDRNLRKQEKLLSTLVVSF